MQRISTHTTNIKLKKKKVKQNNSCIWKQAFFFAVSTKETSLDQGINLSKCCRVDSPHPLNFGVTCCLLPSRYSSPLGFSQWSSNFWRPCRDSSQLHPLLLGTELSLLQKGLWMDWGTPCPSSWPSGCRQQATTQEMSPNSFSQHGCF